MKKLLSIILLLVSCLATAQVAPVLYYDFDQTDPLSPRVGTGNLSAANHEIVTGAVGRAYAQQYQDSITYTAPQGGTVTPITAMSVQLLIKPGYFFLNNRKGILFTLGYMTCNFYTANASNGNFTLNFTTKNGGITHTSVFNFEGVNRAAMQWFLDSSWHHIAFVHNAAGGAKQIYIDGQIALEATGPTGTIDLIANQKLILNNNTDYDQYYGAWDEVAVYNQILPPRQVYQNYLDFQAGNHYTTALAPSIPLPPVLTAPLDSLDFPVGYVMGSTNSSSADYTALEQLTRYSNPRYPYRHTLRRNFSWNDPQYMGGHLQSDVVNARVQSASILKKLYEKYNYMLMAAWNITAGRVNEYGDTNTWVGKWVKLANDNPTWERSVTSFWNQNPTANVQSQALPNNYYLRTSTGTFILNSEGQKILSPAAPNPGLLSNDGTRNRQNLELLLAELVPQRIDFLNDNDEVFALTDTNLLAQDPTVVADKNLSGLNWADYFAYKQTLISKVYRDTTMAPYPSAYFSMYNISGWDGSLGRAYYYPRYNQRRTINTPIGGRLYSTMDFYPRYPKVWRRWQGPWHGVQPFDEAREVEVALGDKIFSPFVSPGWNINEEQNQRPGRFLGLIKCLGIMGVDFYYMGFFNTGNPTVTNPPANPRGYAWQSAAPAYAQAILARVDTIVKTGLFVADVLAEPTKSDTGFATWAGDPRIWCVVRQDSLQNNRYVIAATIQPNSNQTGQVPDSWAGKIKIENAYVRFNVRQQGSVYYYVSDSAKFVQIDSWHERVHPDRWTSDIEMQAEVCDSSSKGSYYHFYNAKTYTTVANDYSNAYSVLTAHDTTERYFYSAYPKVSADYRTYVLARAKPVSGYTKSFKFVFNYDGGVDSNTIAVKADTLWRWYCIQDTFPMIAETEYQMNLSLLSSNMEVDKIVMTTKDTTFPEPMVISPCTSPVIALTVTTPFCDTTTATVTGAGISSYLWSTGMTSASIDITTPGTYSVTVMDNLGCAGDTSFSVTQDVPYVMVVYTQAFCDSTLALAAYPTSVSYLWSNGATTSSIYISASQVTTVTVTNATGCSVDTSFTTTKYVPYARVSYLSPFCDSTLATTNMSNAVSWFWSTGATTSSVYLKNSNFITVTITDVLGCEVDTTFRANKITCDTCFTVRNFRAISKSKTRITYSWTNTSSLAVGHQVYVKDMSTGVETYKPASTDVNYFRATSLKPATIYEVKMRSLCNVNGNYYYTDWTPVVRSSTMP